MELCKIVLSPGIYAQEQHQPWVEIFFEGAYVIVFNLYTPAFFIS